MCGPAAVRRQLHAGPHICDYVQVVPMFTFLSSRDGGPLFPLASQLNDEVIHLQGLRIEGTVGRLAEDMQGALSQLDARTAVAAPTSRADHPKPAA
jgi:hypothetical protein